MGPTGRWVETDYILRQSRSRRLLSPLWGLDIFVEVVDVFHRVPSVPLFQPILAGVKSFEVRTNLYELGVDRGEIKIRTAETPVNPLPDVSDR